jgi:hypothetical protein
LTLALLQQLRGMESERSFLRDAQKRFFSHLFPGVVGLHPSSFHRRVRKLGRCFLEPLRREVLPELVGDPETLIVETRRCLRSFVRARFLSLRAGECTRPEPRGGKVWGSLAVYGVKLHLLCAAKTGYPSLTSSPQRTPQRSS